MRLRKWSRYLLKIVCRFRITVGRQCSTGSASIPSDCFVRQICVRACCSKRWCDQLLFYIAGSLSCHSLIIVEVVHRFLQCWFRFPPVHNHQYLVAKMTMTTASNPMRPAASDRNRIEAYCSGDILFGVLPECN